MKTIQNPNRLIWLAVLCVLIAAHLVTSSFGCILCREYSPLPERLFDYLLSPVSSRKEPLFSVMLCILWVLALLLDVWKGSRKKIGAFIICLLTVVLTATTALFRELTYNLFAHIGTSTKHLTYTPLGWVCLSLGFAAVAVQFFFTLCCCRAVRFERLMSEQMHPLPEDSEA